MTHNSSHFLRVRLQDRVVNYTPAQVARELGVSEEWVGQHVAWSSVIYCGACDTDFDSSAGFREHLRGCRADDPPALTEEGEPSLPLRAAGQAAVEAGRRAREDERRRIVGELRDFAGDLYGTTGARWIADSLTSTLDRISEADQP